MEQAVNSIEMSASPRSESALVPTKGLFSTVDGLGIAVDIILFWVLTYLSMAFNLSQISSLLAGAGLTVAIKCKSSQGPAAAFDSRGWIWPAVLTILAALFLRAGLLAVLIQRAHWSPYVAILVPALAAGVVNAVGWRHAVIPSASGSLYAAPAQSALMPALIMYVLLLKLFYLGLPELLHEEGYYWNYAQHLDIGYLDHPPMVGWVAYVWTSLFGSTEFAVRLGPYSLWFVGAFFLYRLAGNIFDRKTAMGTLLLFAVLPYYFGVSFVLLPDAALVACWAAALYYFHRILIHSDRRAFIGIGICVGLGMLAKYTMALLGLAAFVFVVIDPLSRKWLKSPWPWIAIAVAAFLFLPVIVWNANHEWASFLFQSTRRAGGSFDFDLPDLIGSVLILLTPTGLMALFVIFRARGLPLNGTETVSAEEAKQRSVRLLLVLTAVPLLVFVLFSLFRNTKLIWTGPPLLGVLPIMGAMMSPEMLKHRKRLPVFGPRPWTITAIVCVLIYGACLHFLGLGFPGIPVPKKMLGQGWHDIACQVEAIVEEIEDRTGRRPLVVGMDKDRINSWLAFYRGKCGRQAGIKDLSGSGAGETSGRHIFGKRSGMYRFWFPAEVHTGKTLVLVGRKPKDLTGPQIDSRIQAGGEVKALTAEINGRTIRKNYYRIVDYYHPHN